jgi:ATP-dependent Lon protease
MGIAQIFATTDFHVEAIDLLANRTACEAGVGLVVAICSALKKQPVQPASLIIGDLSIEGNIKAARSIAESGRAGDGGQLLW